MTAPSPASSPYTHSGNDTGAIMRLVLLATLPGILTLTYFFGFGTLVNIVLAAATAVACEAGVMTLRNRPPRVHLRDCSALVTATLLAVAVPPYIPWWIVVVGVAFAIVIAKHLYGGLGYNPFNPAMAGYVVLLISFPVPMTAWAAPIHTVAGQPAPPGLLDALRINLGVFDRGIDAFTMATPLDLLKHNQGLMMSGLWAHYPQFGRWGGRGWEWVNLAFAAGGLALLYRRIYTWHAPVGMLAALAVMAALFYDSGGSGSGGSPLFHLLSGATMLGAFFIVTDPVTSAVSNRGRLIYGIGIGTLTYLIRRFGSYPDAVAFAVLLFNFAAPLIDRYTQPRTYGHPGRRT